MGSTINHATTALSDGLDTLAQNPAKAVGDLWNSGGRTAAEIAAAYYGGSALMGSGAEAAAGSGDVAASASATSAATDSAVVSTSAAADTAAGTTAAASTVPADVQAAYLADTAGTAGASTGLTAAKALQTAQTVLTASSLASTLLTPKLSVASATTPTSVPAQVSSNPNAATTALGLPGTGGGSGSPGVANTLLTGAGGVDPNSLNLGKNTLLGA